MILHAHSLNTKFEGIQNELTGKKLFFPYENRNIGRTFVVLELKNVFSVFSVFKNCSHNSDINANNPRGTDTIVNVLFRDTKKYSERFRHLSPHDLDESF